MKWHDDKNTFTGTQSRKLMQEEVCSPMIPKELTQGKTPLRN